MKTPVRTENIGLDLYLSLSLCLGNSQSSSTLRKSIGRRSLEPKCSSIPLLSRLSTSCSRTSSETRLWTKMPRECLCRSGLRLVVPPNVKKLWLKTLVSALVFILTYLNRLKSINKINLPSFCNLLFCKNDRPVSWYIRGPFFSFKTYPNLLDKMNTLFVMIRYDYFHSH